MRYRIYYGDGSTYRDGPPELAPGTACQVICQEGDSPRGSILMHGANADATKGGYFWWISDMAGWTHGDHAGWILHQAKPGWKKSMFGETIDDEQFRAVLKRAIDEGLG